jgi:hypothetical protein
MRVNGVWLWPGRTAGRGVGGSPVGACGLGEVVA